MSIGFSPRRIRGDTTNSREVEEQDFCGRGCLDLQMWFRGNSGPVAFLQPVAVEFDRTDGDLEPGMTARGKIVAHGLPGFESGEEKIGILIDGDTAIAAGFAGDEVELTSGGIGHGFFLVAGWAAGGVRGDPDLEEAHSLGCGGIEFAVADAGAGGHVLEFIGFDDAAVSHGIAVLEGSTHHITNNFHIAMGMRGKSATPGDDVVIDDAQAAKSHVGGVVVIGERKGESALEPAVVGVAAVRGFAEGDHGRRTVRGNRRAANTILQPGRRDGSC